MSINFRTFVFMEKLHIAKIDNNTIYLGLYKETTIESVYIDIKRIHYLFNKYWYEKNGLKIIEETIRKIIKNEGRINNRVS